MGIERLISAVLSFPRKRESSEHNEIPAFAGMTNTAGLSTNDEAMLVAALKALVPAASLFVPLLFARFANGEPPAENSDGSKFKEAMSEAVKGYAAKLHDNWRTGIDTANVPFERLPKSAQTEFVRRADFAVETIRRFLDELGTLRSGVTEISLDEAVEATRKVWLPNEEEPVTEPMPPKERYQQMANIIGAADHVNEQLAKAGFTIRVVLTRRIDDRKHVVVPGGTEAPPEEELKDVASMQAGKVYTFKSVEADGRKNTNYAFKGRDGKLYIVVASGKLIEQQAAEYRKGPGALNIRHSRLWWHMANHVAVMGDTAGAGRRELLMYEHREPGRDPVGRDPFISYGDLFDILGRGVKATAIVLERGFDTTHYLETPDWPHNASEVQATNRFFAVGEGIDPELARERGLVQALAALGLPESGWEGAERPIAITSIWPGRALRKGEESVTLTPVKKVEGREVIAERLMEISGIADSVRRVREWLRDNEYARANIPSFLISHIAHEILPIFHDILLTEVEKFEAELDKPQPAEAQEKISKEAEEKSLKERLLGAFEWARVFSAALDPKSYKGGLIMPEVPEDISKALEEAVESAWKERFGGDESLQILRDNYVRHNGEERAGSLLLRRLTSELGGTLGGKTISDEKMAELRRRAEGLKAKYEARRKEAKERTRKL